MAFFPFFLLAVHQTLLLRYSYLGAGFFAPFGLFGSADRHAQTSVRVSVPHPSRKRLTLGEPCGKLCTYKKGGIFVKLNKRSERVLMRVTPAEKAALSKLAAAAGLSLTAFLVGCALGDAVGRVVEQTIADPSQISIDDIA